MTSRLGCGCGRGRVDGYPDASPIKTGQAVRLATKLSAECGAPKGTSRLGDQSYAKRLQPPGCAKKKLFHFQSKSKNKEKQQRVTSSRLPRHPSAGQARPQASGSSPPSRRSRRRSRPRWSRRSRRSCDVTASKARYGRASPPAGIRCDAGYPSHCPDSSANFRPKFLKAM